MSTGEPLGGETMAQMSEDERLVRETWEDIKISKVGLPDNDYEVYNDGPPIEEGDLFLHAFGKTREEAIRAAAEFTRERLEEIRQVEEEIKLIKTVLDIDWVRLEWLADAERILVREQAALTELRRGMREPEKTA